MKTKYFSTFSGIGGFELGIGDKGECVGFSEIDKYAAIIYQEHFPNHHNYGDITKINPEELPDFDLLVGGFPCQAFSIAGKRAGFSDTRGTLFFEIARIVKQKLPRLLLLENVKGLLSHDEGRTFRTIMSVIDDMGYDAQWQVLNSKNHGVPQNRERVLIVGHLRGTPRPEVFPFGESNEGDTESQSETCREGERVRGNIASTLMGRDHKGGGNLIQLNQPIHSNDRVYDIDGISPTLNTMQGGNRQPFIVAQRGRYNEGGETEQRIEARDDFVSNTLTSVQKDNMVMIPEATKKGYAEARVGQSINLSVPNSKTRRGRVSDVAQTLDTGMQQHTLTSDMRIRRLTPTECERLQGFPDGWTLQGGGKRLSKVQVPRKRCHSECYQGHN